MKADVSINKLVLRMPPQCLEIRTHIGKDVGLLQGPEGHHHHVPVQLAHAHVGGPCAGAQ